MSCLLKIQTPPLALVVFKAKIRSEILPPFSKLASACVASSPAQQQRISLSNKLRETELQTPEKPRRSANYQPPNWDFDYVQSLKNEYSGEMFIRRRDELKESVKKMLDDEEAGGLLQQLEFIDDLQRLGLLYHFQGQIQSILSRIHSQNCINAKNLQATALGFRLMRQHGLHVSQERFDSFKDEEGNFKANLCKDIKGLLQLYEASYFQTENETTLESAKEFAARHLQKSLDDEETGIQQDPELALLVQHALQLPLHWRVPRVEARWFIDVYEKRLNKNDTLLQLAKIDFNIVQAIHQNDLKSASRWWENTCLGRRLNFARNRLVENFFWTIGFNFGPEYGYYRRMATQVNSFITIIDDIYDVHGTLDELELFTHAVESWNIEVMDDLPDYMKICYLVLFNATNETAYNAMKEQGIHSIPYLKKAWADLCKTYLQEAKWYYSGYTPTLQEYLDNAWISISAPVILVHAYFVVSNPITKEALECLQPYHNIIRYSAMVLRLIDDLGTSSEEMKRGDVPKSVECYMNETGVSEEEARAHIRFLIGEIWKKLNEERVAELPFSFAFVETALNVARMSQCIYEYGDGHGHHNRQTKDRIQALLFEPICVSYDQC